MDKWELQQIVSDYSTEPIEYDEEFKILNDKMDLEFKILNDKIDLLALLVFRTTGYTNAFKRSKYDRRKNISKSIKDIADVFDVEFKTVR